jgi:hypothetical protein
MKKIPYVLLSRDEFQKTISACARFEYEFTTNFWPKNLQKYNIENLTEFILRRHLLNHGFGHVQISILINTVDRNAVCKKLFQYVILTGCSDKEAYCLKEADIIIDLINDVIQKDWEQNHGSPE